MPKALRAGVWEGLVNGSHTVNAPLLNLQSRNYLEKAVQQTDLPDLLTLSCQHAVRTKLL